MAVGLGGEQLWLSPTVANNVNPFNDQSGQGNNGTGQGGISTVADTGSGGSYAYDFDGIDDYIDGSLSTALGSSVSSSCWIKFDAAPTATETFISNDGFTTDGWLVQRLATTPAKLRYAEDASVSSFCDNSYLNSTGWRHIVSVRDGSTVSLYIDGVQLAVTNSSITGAIAKTAFNIGRRLDSASQYSACVMDDIRFYDRVLTQSEVSWLATERGVLGTPPEGLGDEQLWLCPSIQDSANDLSGNGNNGSYQNGTATVADTDATYGGTRAYFSNAISQCVLVPNFGESLSDTTSISIWVKSVNPWVCVPVAKGGLGYSTAIWQYALFNSGPSRILRRLSANLTLSGTTPSDQWQHIVIIRDNGSSTQEVYVDGVLDVTSASSTGTYYYTNQTWFGFGNVIGTNEELYMDDMRTYGRVLTQAEITHLASQRGVLGSPATTTQYNAFVTHAFRQLFQTRLR